ncbi:hypothetical protein M413DRAFT_323246 [Hebeloma cylindrosporum]|uniref:Uncharacterized protein n=1 Tax=Hebeloma cylindrosporum TaxID=76867 RepID=A0A0C2XDK6_HEBCY|nr:hypothetical protein M413DRAFT_323246 [Hebeloma cylindrosporum h7]
MIDDERVIGLQVRLSLFLLDLLYPFCSFIPPFSWFLRPSNSLQLFVHLIIYSRYSVSVFFFLYYGRVSDLIYSLIPVS